MIKKTVYIIIATCFFIQQAQAIVVNGDPNAANGDTFSFEVGHAVLVRSENEGNRLWTASSEAITNEDSKKFALSYIQQVGPEPLFNLKTGEQIPSKAIPMANEGSATIFSFDGNNVTASLSANPIFGASFSFFGMFGIRPAFVVTNELHKIYLTHELQRYENPTTNQINKTELLAYNLGNNEEVAGLHVLSTSIFAAHATNGNFGTNTSTISKLVTNAVEQNNARFPFLQLAAQATINTGIEALLGGTNNLANIGSSVAFHTFQGTTYVGLETTASNGGTDIATGAMIITNNETDLIFNKLIDDQALSSAKNTIVSAPNNSTVRIQNITGMSTTTSLNYLIVARDNGTGPQSIYAAPLVSEVGSNFGKIADATQIKNSFYGTPGRFHKRTFTTPLTDVTQINIDDTTDFTEQITVGKGAIPLAAGDIQQLYTVGDSVYVVIGDAYAANTKPGTFCSQAIFASDGHIISWTPWTRIGGSDEPMNFSTVSTNTTTNFYISDAGNGFKKISQSQWDFRQNLSTFLHTAYFDQGGTQGLFNFSDTTPGFNNALSLLIATGFNRISIGQTGYNTPGQFQIKTIDQNDIVSFSNVNENTALIAAELAHSGVNHWLFAGGSSGLAVLTGDITGYTHTGNFGSVQDFNAGQTWKQVGDFSSVKKLLWDTDYIYILTTKGLYRIALDPNKFLANPTVDLNIETILESLQLSNKPGFLDAIIDNNFCIIGTTNGMYSFNVSNNTAINRISIPDGLPAISKLFVVSSQNEAQRNFKTKSNLYVLNNTFGSQQSQINRFTIENSIITPFNDALLSSTTNPSGEATSFIRFNNYISNYFTNGSWNLASNYFLGTTQPVDTISPGILQLGSYIKNGNSSSHITISKQSFQVPINFLRGVDNFLGILSESTSGALIASGNFEARVNS